MFLMNSKTFLRILFVLKVGALEEAQSAAKSPNEKKPLLPGSSFLFDWQTKPIKIN